MYAGGILLALHLTLQLHLCTTTFTTYGVLHKKICLQTDKGNKACYFVCTKREHLQMVLTAHCKTLV